MMSEEPPPLPTHVAGPTPIRATEYSAGCSGRPALALGCGMMLMLLGCCGGCIWGLYRISDTAISVVVGMVEDRSYLDVASQKVEAHPEVQEALGSPVEVNEWFGIETESTSIGNSISFRVPVHGPEADGHVIGQATEAGDGSGWEFIRLQVQVEGETRIINVHRGSP